MSLRVPWLHYDHDTNNIFNEHSYEATTKAYQNHYNSFYQKQTTTTTQNYYSTTRNPFQHYTVSTPPPSYTYPPSINRYSISTTKNPYDFKDFTTRNYQSKGYYDKNNYSNYFSSGTTKNPYQKVQPVFKIGTYYSQPNSIRPDANSQQVQIEPARLVFSYQRNLTTGEIQQ